MISVIVFLGNPGREYSQTRHNAGWLACTHLVVGIEAGTCFPDSGNSQISWTQKFKAQYAKIKPGGQSSSTNDVLHLLLPQNYYNTSGESLQSLLQFFKLPLDQVLVVHDDLETPFGRLTLQFAGGLGGNKGLKSVVNQCGGQDFYRLKIGIGRPVHGKPDAWVLSRFSQEEEPELPMIFDQATKWMVSLATKKSLGSTLKEGRKQTWNLGG
jgi:PTH1 family peptidyl-tRNA hydrolase